MSSRIVLKVVLGTIALLATANCVQAGVSTLQQSVNVDRPAGDATFKINFGHAPDFFTTDSHGRLADSFQIQISSDPTADPQIFPTTVIRGDEIQFTKTAIPVRDGSPPSSDPHSGGFGAIRGTVPFSINGSELSFTAPLSLIGAPNGMFSYYAFTLHDGATVGQAEARSVPLPAALQAGLMMLGLGVLFMIFRSLKRLA